MPNAFFNLRKLRATFRIFRFITRHPLTADHPFAAIARFLRWQVSSRIHEVQTIDWIGDARIVARRGMAGITGNIYCGLHEFADMAFLLNLVRPGDLFLDIGANVGSYTILASKVRGAKTIAVEADPTTMEALHRNINVNQIEELVTTHQVVVGAEKGTIHFTIGLDSVNRVVTADHLNARMMSVETLDSIVGDEAPTFVKLDVEGYENAVLEGASSILSRPSLLAIETELADVDVIKRLESAGFHRASYLPHERKLVKGVVENGAHNALFIRDFEACARRIAEAVPIIVLGHRV